MTTASPRRSPPPARPRTIPYGGCRCGDPIGAILDSKIADLNNVSDGPQGGAITAALYLQEFVEPGIPWAHLDVMAWNNRTRPGRPEGAEAQTLRALYAHIAGRFG